MAKRQAKRIYRELTAEELQRWDRANAELNPTVVILTRYAEALGPVGTHPGKSDELE